MKEHTPRTRIALLIRLIADSPRLYTRKQLAEKYDVHPDTILDDLKHIRNAGFVLEQDTRYRYFFLENKPYKQLENLLHFTETDQLLLSTHVINWAL